MADISYRIALDTGDVIVGSTVLTEGINSVTAELSDSVIVSATAEIAMKLGDGEKIFMNGFQTWTSCPEYDRSSKIRGVRGMPKFLVNKFAMDRYGDYHFYDYENKRGITHGYSYMYLRNGEDFRFLGSVSERQGYTIFTYDAEKGILRIKRDCEGLRFSGSFHAFDLYYREGNENEVFDGWFAAMDIRPRTQDKIAGYSSWYNRYQNISAETILQDLKGCSGVLEQGDLFQIDDGWEPFVGDWLEADSKKFPDGMAKQAEAIHKAGFRAGLWLAPFVAQKGSATLKDHPDWFIRRDGKPWCDGCNWGGFYSLDIDNPEVEAYIRETFRKVFDEWHFDLVKLDFLYGAAPFGSENETRAGRMYRALELLRECCGDKMILGCGVPVVPAFGLVDYCRVSCDVGLDWNDVPYMRLIMRERVSTRNAIWNDIFRRQLNGRAYLSDPDVFFLRDDNIKLTEEVKLKLAQVCGVFGGVFLTSDDMSKYTEEKKKTYRELRKLMHAQDVKVENADTLRFTYTVDGEKREVTIFDKE